MLIKEYRILLPLTVDEYRIAQLYMIQKKSRLDSHGTDSGVEIITNRPYERGPGGSGQYTFKIYHIGSRIPVWIRSVIPSNALEAHEEAWNAYPITKTRYSTPLMDRLNIEVDTLYFNDSGIQENVFNLPPHELKHRVVDVMDFVKESVTSHDYCAEEDPKLFRSTVTGRGPLSEDWVQERVAAGQPVMCAYKLCRVEFRYWGLQTRAERWIHDLALRGTMLRAHRQAWAWQDEWYGLTIEDIRRLEAETALHLSEVMANASRSVELSEENGLEESDDASSDIYFDCTDTSPPHSTKPSIIRWSSELLLETDSPPTTPSARRSASLLILLFHGDLNPDGPADSKTTDTNTFRSTIESLVERHYPQLKVQVLLVSCGSELVGTVERVASLAASDSPSSHPSLALLLAANQCEYLDARDGAIRRANQVFNDFLATQPYFNGEVFVVGDAIGGLMLYELLALKSPHTQISRHSSIQPSRVIPEECDVVVRAPEVLPMPPSRHEHSSRSDFIAQILSRRISTTALDSSSVMPSTSRGSTGYSLPGTPSVLCNGSRSNEEVLLSGVRPISAPNSGTLPRKRHSLSVCSHSMTQSPLNFQATSAFLLGCPLGLLLMQRQLQGQEIETVENTQVFNLYYPLDMCGVRIEPLLNPQLSSLPAAVVSRYQRCPLGDGRSILFDRSVDVSNLWGNKRHDYLLYCPNAMESLPSSALPNILHASYWESCDVAAFVLRQFVRGDEYSTYHIGSSSVLSPPSPHAPLLTLPLPSLHWRKRRTRFKITNLSPNHRANDAIVVTGNEQTISAKFCYGPMDLVALTREAVSIYICPVRKEWYLHGVSETDSHGRLSLSLGKSLPCGVHSLKLVVQGDHSYLDAFIAVVPPDTPVVVFSIDGSLTGSVSVTGRDPRVRPGAVDVVRFWHEQGFLLLYVTARPDMQQRAVAGWLAQHNFPHALLYFAPSFSTDPLKQKGNYLKSLQLSRVRIHAAYGSNKDVAVYTAAGVDQERIVAIGGKRKQSGCLVVESYSAHLAELSEGICPLVNSSKADNNENALNIRPHRSVQRTSSFTPRNGKLDQSSHSEKR